MVRVCGSAVCGALGVLFFSGYAYAAPCAPTAPQVIANGCEVVVPGGTFVTGANRPAFSALNAGTIQVTGVIDVDTTGNSSHGALAQSNGDIFIFGGGTIDTNGLGSYGLYATNPGSTITATGLVLNMSGAESYGIRGQDRGVVTLNGGSITSTASAMFAAGGAIINATNVAMSTTLPNAVGVNANGGTINLTGGSVTASPGVQNHGLNASGGGHITADGVTVIATGNGVRATGANSTLFFQNGSILGGVNGVIAESAGVATVNDSTVTTNNANAHSLFATGAGSKVNASHVVVTTNGATAFGAHALGGGTIALTNGSTIATTGSNSFGVIADGANSAITAAGLTVTSTDHAIAARNGGVVTVDGGTATSQTSALRIFNNATINVTNVAATATGADAIGALNNGGIMNITGGSVTALVGAGDHGIHVSGGAGAVTTATGVTVNASGRGLSATGDGTLNFTGGSVTGGTAGALADTGGQLNLGDSTIVTTNANAPGLFATDAGSLISATDVGVTTSGVAAHGAHATSGGIITSTGGSIATSGSDAFALFADTPSSRVEATNAAVTATGSGSLGAYATGGGAIELTGGTITGPTALWADTASTITASGVDIVATDATGSGARANGGIITIDGGSVTTTGGIAAHGLNATAAASSLIDADGVTLVTSGDGIHVGDGALVTFDNGSIESGAFGAQAFAGGRAEINASTIETSNPGAAGLFVFDAASSIATEATSITTTGALAHGAHAQDGGTIDLADVTIDVAGAGAFGLFADTGATITVGLGAAGQGSSIVTTGADGHGVEVRDNARVDATALTVAASGSGANALFLTGAPGSVQTANFTDSALTASAVAINVSGATANVVITDSTVEAPVAINVAGNGGDPAVLNMTIDPSTVTGAIITEALSTSNITFIDSTWNLTGNSNVTALTNDASLILFSPPAGGVFKTLTVEDYVGNGGTIGLNTFLGGDGSPSDKLVIDGGTASGTTGVAVTNAGGPGAPSLLNGILVVETVNGGTTGAGVFDLSERAVAGAFEYFLFRGARDGAAANANNWYLRSEAPPPCDPDTDPDCPPPPPPPCDPETDPDCPNPPPPPPPPVFRPEVAVYLTNARSAMGMFLHTLHERLGEPQFADDAKPADDSVLGSAWVRVVGRHNEVDSHGAYGFDTEATTWLVQGGIELADWSLAEDGSAGRAHFGLMAGYGQANVDSTALGNPNPGSGEVDGYSVGAYGTFYQHDVDRMGLYVDMWGQFGFFDNEITSARLDPTDYDTWTGTASVEVGYAFKTDLDDRIVFEPQAQAVYVHYQQDDFVEPNGTRVSDADLGVAVTRLGLRTFGTWVDDDGGKYEPYLELNWWHDFAGEQITLNQLSFTRGTPEDRFEVGAGLNVEIAPDCTLWANAEYQVGDNYQGVEGMIGVKYAW